MKKLPLIIFKQKNKYVLHEKQECIGQEEYQVSSALKLNSCETVTPTVVLHNYLQAEVKLRKEEIFSY